MTPSAFRPTPALGSPPGLGTHGNRPPLPPTSRSSGTQDHPAPAHRGSPLSTERALPSPPALSRCGRLRDCCSERRRGEPSVRAQPRGKAHLDRAGRQSRYVGGGLARQGGVADEAPARSPLGSGCVPLGSPRRGSVWRREVGRGGGGSVLSPAPLT